MTQHPALDAMPTTRGTNFFLADPNLQHVGAEAERELDARPVADALDHALGGALLLAGARYLKKWLRPPAPPASVFTARECDHLPALIDWTPVAVEALAPDGSC